MKTRITKALSWMLALALIATLCVQIGVPVKAEPTGDTVAIQDGVTLHCWNWSFENIEANMEKIASLGYTAIQTSPIQQAKQATKDFPSNDWWVYYQPMGFHIDDSGKSALGNKAAFQSMCEAAHEYGIQVIVDVVANHMGNTETGGNGLASTIIEDLATDESCWHDVNKNINNYSDRTEVTQYCMAGLPDLNTASDKVQTYVLDYLKECIDAGADGFRFDAVKHIETPEDGDLASDFWPTVVDGAKDYAQSSRGIELYCYGELLDNPGGSLPVSAYTKYMSITDNTWSSAALGAVKGGNAGSFSANYHKSAEANQLVLWAESHDTFADGSTMNITEDVINRAWALIAARSDAMSLYLARPANMSQLLGAASNTAWAFPEVAAVNAFHNQFIGESEYVANEAGIAYVERGTAGVVLVNCKGGSADVSVTANAMADGTYTDKISGNTFTVADGKITGTIGSETGIAVVYQTEACTHAEHDADGFCTSCMALIGHSYDENDTCACGDKKVALRTVYFANNSGWSSVNFYSWYDDINIYTSAWPGDPMTKVEGNIYSCTVPADIPNIIFNDGTNQTHDLTVPAESTGKDMFDSATNDWSTYSAEPSEPTEPSEPETQPTEAPTTAPTAAPTEAPTVAPTQPTQQPSDSGIDPIAWVIIPIAAVVIIGGALIIRKKRG